MAALPPVAPALSLHSVGHWYRDFAVIGSGSARSASAGPDRDLWAHDRAACERAGWRTVRQVAWGVAQGDLPSRSRAQRGAWVTSGGKAEQGVQGVRGHTPKSLG